jgi:hypothetical protein
MPVFIVSGEQDGKRHLSADCDTLRDVPEDRIARVRNTRKLRERTERCDAGCWADYEAEERAASATPQKKPANATWIAKTTVTPRTADFSTTGDEHAFEEVEVAWYGSDRIKLTLKGGAPAAIYQVYLPGTGRDVILDLGALDV